jgi:Lrp/AsnC family leucine-responsive transcriptional regulator
MTNRAVPTAVDLDPIAWKILEALQHNARLSFAELGRKVGLSAPATAERVHRLEEAGVITGYHASLNMARLGMPIHVIVRLTINGGDVQVTRTVAAIKELTEVSSIGHLEALIDKLNALGATSTSTVLSTPVKRREYRAAQIEAFNRYG